jgi:hypothetical protein
MIHYQLRCDDGHEFDGWFSDSTSFEKQAKRGLVECPACGSAKVHRALMTPAVPRKGNTRPEPTPAPAAKAKRGRRWPVQNGPNGRMPAQMYAMLQRLRAEIEANCEHVGPRFAEEARKIHKGESEERGIYGETTPEEAEALAEEGINIASIPWVPRADG